MGQSMAFRENIRAKRENDFGLENALAGYVRRRWPEKAIPHVQHEWGLSEHEAAKVVYAQASKNTLRKLLHHKRGGFALFVELIADATSTSLEQHIRTQAEKAAHEEREAQAEARRQAVLLDLVSGRGGDLGGLDQPHRGRRAPDEDVGAGTPTR